MRRQRPALDPQSVAEWCSRALDGRPRRTLFEVGYLSQVLGLELEDDRRVVVKVRPWANRPLGCAGVHEEVFRAGYPCPQPLTGVDRVEGWAISAESLVAEHSQLQPAPDSPRLFANALALLVELASTAATRPSLDPSPPWADWQNPGRERLWPEPDDRVVDLNQLSTTWVDIAAATVRRSLLEMHAPPTVGHLDWYSANLGWDGRKLAAVFDWDSIGMQPEAAIAGLAAAVWPATGGPGEEASVQQSEEFLLAYAQARHLSDSDVRGAWAAGLWVRCFDAKKAEAVGDNPDLVITKAEARQRLRRAGLPDDL